MRHVIYQNRNSFQDQRVYELKRQIQEIVINTPQKHDEITACIPGCSYGCTISCYKDACSSGCSSGCTAAPSCVDGCSESCKSGNP